MKAGELIGRYEVTGSLGRGAMAQVHLARHAELGRLVALKELAAYVRDDPAFAARFSRESQVAAALSHPNIVTVYDYFEHDGVPYIAMEHMSQGSLRDYEQKLTLPQIAGVLEGVLAGLTHAHEHDVIHRDLKPENILIGADGRAKIADFGIAKLMRGDGGGQRITAAGAAIGTPAYMAPEQGSGGEVGRGADLYAVGVIAFELLTGRVPFEGVDPAPVLVRHMTERPPRVDELEPGVDADLADWVDRMLAKDPGDRFRSALAAWDDLDDVIAELEGPRWRRRARLSAAPAGEERPRALTPAPFQTSKPKVIGGGVYQTIAAGGPLEAAKPVVAPPSQSGNGPAAPPPAVAEPEPAAAEEPPAASVALPVSRWTAMRAWLLRRRWLVAATAGAAVLIVVLLLALGGGGSSLPDAPAFARPAALGGDWVRGVHVDSGSADGYGDDDGRAAIDRARSGGAAFVSLAPVWSMSSPRASSVDATPPRLPTDAALESAARAAREAGMRVIVHPVGRVRGSDSTGDVAPADVGRWFASYRAVVERSARLAARVGASILVVGDELSALAGDTARWQPLIALARRLAPDAQLTFAADALDDAQATALWSSLDLIGVNAWMGITTARDPSVAQLVRGWQPYVQALSALSSQYGDKPVFFTTLGYASRDGAARAPFAESGRVTDALQARLYEAAFRALAGQRWFRGIAWDGLSADGADKDPGNGGLWFRGKPAEGVMHAWHTK